MSHSPFGTLVFVFCSLAIAFVVGGTPPAIATESSPWTIHDSPTKDHLYDVTVLDAKRAFAVGWGTSEGAVILATRDGGATWTQTSPVRGAYLFSIRFPTESLGFAAGYDPAKNCGLILMTRNGGKSWKATHVTKTFGLYDLAFLSPKLGFACGYGGGIFRTQNGGRSWTKLETGTADEVFRWLSFADEKNGFAAAGDDFATARKIYRTTDGGRRWTVVHTFEDGTALTGLAAIDANRVAASCMRGQQSGALLYSEDAGVSWRSALDGKFFPQSLRLDGESGWAIGAHGFVAQTDSGGASWRASKTPAKATVLGIDARDGLVVAVGSDGLTMRRALD